MWFIQLCCFISSLILNNYPSKSYILSISLFYSWLIQNKYKSHNGFLTFNTIKHFICVLNISSYICCQKHFTFTMQSSVQYGVFTIFCFHYLSKKSILMIINHGIFYLCVFVYLIYCYHKKDQNSQEAQIETCNFSYVVKL